MSGNTHAIKVNGQQLTLLSLVMNLYKMGNIKNKRNNRNNHRHVFKKRKTPQQKKRCTSQRNQAITSKPVSPGASTNFEQDRTETVTICMGGLE